VVQNNNNKKKKNTTTTTTTKERETKGWSTLLHKEHVPLHVQGQKT
jgi:hypothetical protein